MPNDQATRAKEAAQQLFKETMTAKKQPPEQISRLALIADAERRAEEVIAKQRQARLNAVSEASAAANSKPATTKPKP